MKSRVAIKAATIRKELKEMGITSKQVSVRSENYSMGSSIEITIKDFSISKTEIEKVAKKQESIYRCDVTGEILSGGNRFVFVKYDTYDVPESYKAKTRAAIAAAMNYYNGIYCVSDLQDHIHRNEKIKIDGCSLEASNLLMYKYTNQNYNVLRYLINEERAA